MILFANPCPMCGEKTVNEVHRDCVEASLSVLPSPASLTGEQRYAEMMQYQNYPAGWPLDLLEKRVCQLIGRELYVPPWGEGEESLIRALATAETLPRFNNPKGWERLAVEARDNEPIPLLEN